MRLVRLLVGIFLASYGFYFLMMVTFFTPSTFALPFLFKSDTEFYSIIFWDILFFIVFATGLYYIKTGLLKKTGVVYKYEED